MKARTIGKKRVIRIALFLMVSAYALFFTEANFKRIRLSIPGPDINTAGEDIIIRFHSQPLASSTPEKWLLECRATLSQEENRLLPLLVNHRRMADISLRPGKNLFRIPIEGILPASENTITIPNAKGQVQIEGLEIKNISGFSTGLMEMFLLDRSYLATNWRQNRSFPFLAFLFFLALLQLLFSRIEGYEDTSSPSRHPKHPHLLRALHAILILLFLSPVWIRLFLGQTLLVSRHTFLFLWTGAGIFLLYSRGILLHSILLKMGKNALMPCIRYLQVHASDRRYLIQVLLLPVLFLTLYLVTSFDFYFSSFQENGDGAAYALQIERAKHFSEYLGPYSRFEFNHPGPISFYYFALSEKLFPFIPTPLGRQFFGQLLLNFAFLIFALHIVYYAFPRKSYAQLLFLWLLLALALRPLGTDIFSRTWPPFLLIFPMLLFILSIAKISFGELRFVLPAAISFTFIFQNNLSSSAIVFPFSICALGAYIWNKKRHSISISKTDKKALIIAAALVLVCFLPPLYEQLTEQPGNISKIITFFTHRTGLFHPLNEAIDTVFDYFKAPWSYLLSMDVVILMFFLGFLAVLAVKKERSYLNHLVFYVLLGIMLSIVGAMKVPEQLMFYIFLYEFAFVILLYFVCSISIVNLVHFPKINRTAVTLFLVFYVALLTLRFYHTRPEPNNNPPFDQLVKAIQPDKESTYELYLEKMGQHHDQWEAMASVALMMTRQGYRVAVSSEWSFLFGNQMVLRNPKDPVKRIVFYNRDRHPQQTRENSATVSNSTIEFGDLIPLVPPIRLGADSSDEYFKNWGHWPNGLRFMSDDSARISFPLGRPDIALEQQPTLTVSAQASPGSEYQVKVNDHPLSPLLFQESSLEKTWALSEEMLKPGAANTIVFTKTRSPASPLSPTSYFTLKQIDLVLASKPSPDAGKNRGR